MDERKKWKNVNIKTGRYIYRQLNNELCWEINTANKIF